MLHYAKKVTCKDCYGAGGHSSYSEAIDDLVAFECENCGGTGRVSEVRLKRYVCDSRSSLKGSATFKNKIVN